MTPKVEEAVRFLRLAQRDRAAFALPAAAAEIDDAIACFHAQQSAEMALKTVLCLRGIEYQTRPRSERELGRWASCVRQRTGQGRRRCAYWTYLRTAARVYLLEDNLRG